MNYHGVLSLAVSLLLTPLLGAAEVNGSKTTEQDAAAQVRRLGDESFEVRDGAARRLAELGRQAEAALRLGIKDTDPEVRRQCTLLLERATRPEMLVALDEFLLDGEEKHVAKLPAWTRFAKLAGKDAAAKSLFVDMCCKEAVLLEALEKDPKSASEEFSARCLKMQLALFSGNVPRPTVTLGQVAALLFLATDPRLQLSPQAFYPLSSLIQQPLPRDGFQKNAVARKLLVAYLEKRNDAALQNQNLFLAMSFNLKECTGWAMKIASSNKSQPYARATALALVGKLGTREHIAELEKFLTDKTLIGQSTYNSVPIHTEIRDVALAAIIQLSGQEALDYGYPFLKANERFARGNPQYVFSAPALLGFSDNADREAALKRWKEGSETK